MEVRTDSNNVYYNFNNNNNLREDRIQLDNEPLTGIQNQENQTNTQNNTTDVTQLPRVELPPEEVRALYTDRLGIQINQEILNGATQTEDVDFNSQSVDVSLRDISQLQRQLNRNEILDNIASTPQSQRGENLNEIDPEELARLREENQELTQEELASLYFNRQAQESREQQAEIYLNNIDNNDVEENDNEVSFEDINDLQTTLNRTEVLDNIASTPQSERPDRPSVETSPTNEVNENEEAPDAIIDQDELRQRILEEAEEERRSNENEEVV